MPQTILLRSNRWAIEIPLSLTTLSKVGKVKLFLSAECTLSGPEKPRKPGAGNLMILDAGVFLLVPAAENLCFAAADAALGEVLGDCDGEEFGGGEGAGGACEGGGGAEGEGHF